MQICISYSFSAIDYFPFLRSSAPTLQNLAVGTGDQLSRIFKLIDIIQDRISDRDIGWLYYRSLLHLVAAGAVYPVT